jgi:hypothetical protein
MSAGMEVLIVLAVVIVIGAAAIYAMQARRTKQLKERFGPEYARVVEETGNRSAAEAKLEHRRLRVQKLNIRGLETNERAQFQDEWREIQAHFVDDPSKALSEADHLVGEVMAAEGYPMREFDERAEDISVDHPSVCDNYREAHSINAKNVQGRATTEDLRKAMIHYRTLFEDLVGQRELAGTERV